METFGRFESASKTLNRRRAFLFASMAMLGRGVQAQTAARARRIGFLAAAGRNNLAANVQAFREGLRDVGYREGRDIIVEYRYAEGRSEQLQQLAKELVRLNPEVIVTEGSESIQAVTGLTRKIPIVMAQAGDPISAGFIKSLARPGANVTGVITLSLGLVGKQMELLKEMLPRLDRFAAIWDPKHPGHPAALPAIQDASRTLGIELQLLEASNALDLDKALKRIADIRADAFAAVSDALYDVHQGRIAQFSLQNKIPSAYTKDFAQYGGLLSYGAHFPTLFRRSAIYVDKLLKGGNAADLPVEQPTRFELIVNLKTARALNIPLTRDFLARVDAAIE